MGQFVTRFKWFKKLFHVLSFIHLTFFLLLLLISGLVSGENNKKSIVTNLPTLITLIDVIINAEFFFRIVVRNGVDRRNQRVWGWACRIFRNFHIVWVVMETCRLIHGYRHHFYLRYQVWNFLPLLKCWFLYLLSFIFRLFITSTKRLPKLPDTTDELKSLKPKHESIEYDGSTSSSQWRLKNFTTKHVAIVALTSERNANHFSFFCDVDDASNIHINHQPVTQRNATITFT